MRGFLMIDIRNERLLSLTELPDHLPKRRGKKINISTIYRWAQRGCRGKRLETCTIGGIRYTSFEALNRFFADKQAEQTPQAGTRHKQAKKELEDLLA